VVQFQHYAKILQHILKHVAIPPLGHPSFAAQISLVLLYTAYYIDSSFGVSIALKVLLRTSIFNVSEMI
jgi:hypothetical protein